MNFSDSDSEAIIHVNAFSWIIYCLLFLAMQVFNGCRCVVEQFICFFLLFNDFFRSKINTRKLLNLLSPDINLF